MGDHHNMPRPCKLTFDLLTLKVVSESLVTWAISVPIVVFLGLSVLDLGPMYATDRQTSNAHHHLMPPALWAGANNTSSLARHKPNLQGLITKYKLNYAFEVDC